MFVHETVSGTSSHQYTKMEGKKNIRVRWENMRKLSREGIFYAHEIESRHKTKVVPIFNNRKEYDWRVKDSISNAMIIEERKI